MAKSSGVGRKCIPNACMECRKRKSKCDGNKPVCRSCADVYDSKDKCIYDLNQDMRRKEALRNEIKNLRESQKRIIDFLHTGSKTQILGLREILRSAPPEQQPFVDLRPYIAQITDNDETPQVDAVVLHHSLIDCFDNTPDQSLAIIDHHAGHGLIYWTDITSNEAFLQELLCLYISWCHPSHRLFTAENFILAPNGKCTKLLANAVFALGCLFSEDPEAYSNPEDPDSKGDHFFMQCQSLVQVERFGLPAVQSSALMTIFLVMKNKIEEAKVCAGRMRNWFLDSRLDESFNPGGRTEDELEARKITFWCCLNIETMWALCRGQHTFIDENVFYQEVPALDPRRDAITWSPFGLPGFEDINFPSHQDSLLKESCALSHLVDGMLRNFYAPHERVTAFKLNQHHQKLENWLNGLPAPFRAHNEFMLPQVITLHMSYHNCVILLFRPYMDRGSASNGTRSRMMCVQSANAISSLLSLFQRDFGLKRMGLFNCHAILTAAIVHLIVVSFSNPFNKEETQIAEMRLVEGIRAMTEMTRGATPALATHCLKAITHLTSVWSKGTIPPKIKAALDDAEAVLPRPKSPSPQNEPETESTATPHPLALQQTIPYGANMPLQNLTPVSGTSQMVQGYNGAPPDPLPYGYSVNITDFSDYLQRGQPTLDGSGSNSIDNDSAMDNYIGDTDQVYQEFQGFEAQ